MRTVDNEKHFWLNRDATSFSEKLSSSKRCFIESWRESVSVHMTNGNICNVTVEDMMHEPAILSPRSGILSPIHSSVKFSYNHANDDVNSHCSKLKSNGLEKDRSLRNKTRTTLPPSPNGVLVQNGLDIKHSYKQRTSAMRATKNDCVAEEPLKRNNPNEYTRKSSLLAREMFEKYNMKSKTHNMLEQVGKNSANGYEQFSMPWRNKTFLSLPLRFNGNAHRKDSRLTREVSFVSELRDDDCNGSREDFSVTKDWNDIDDW